MLTARVFMKCISSQSLNLSLSSENSGQVHARYGRIVGLHAFSHQQYTRESDKIKAVLVYLKSNVGSNEKMLDICNELAALKRCRI